MGWVKINHVNPNYRKVRLVENTQWQVVHYENTYGTLHSAFYALHPAPLTLQISLHTFHSAYCKLYNIVLCTLPPAQCILHIVHCTQHFTLRILHFVHCTQHIALHTLHSAHCTLCISICSLHSVKWDLHILSSAHCALHITPSHCTLHSSHSIVHILLCTLHTAY